jgi:hypothetical protein
MYAAKKYSTIINRTKVAVFINPPKMRPEGRRIVNT